MSMNGPRLIEELHCLKEHNKIKTLFEEASQGHYILSLIFVAGTAVKDFSEDEKKQIYSLLFDKFSFIQASVNHTEFIFKKRLDCWYLKQRSALQYLIDYYVNFSGEDNTVEKENVLQKLNDCISKLDTVIRKWSLKRRDFDSKEIMSRFNVPEKHTWWMDSSRNTVRKMDTKQKKIRKQSSQKSIQCNEQLPSFNPSIQLAF